MIGEIDEDFDDDEFTAEELEEIEEELVDAATAAQTVEELDAELLDLARPDRGCRAGPGVGHRPEVVRAAHDPRGQHARDRRRRRRAAQADHLHRAPRHPRLPRAAGSARCSAGPRRSRRSTAACAAPSAAQITEEFTQEPGLPDPARHRRRRRGPEPPGRAPDGQLRPAVEPEPDRAALRPHPPHRPARGLPPVEPRRRQHPRGRGLQAAAGEDRGAAQGLRRQGVRRARRGVQRDAAARRC